MNKKLIRSAFLDDPEVLSLLEKKEREEELKEGSLPISALKSLFKGDDGRTPVKGQDYFTKEEIDQIKADVIKGATPIKFKDYFTESEIKWIMDEMTSVLKPLVTPIKGKDYFDGEDGDDATVDEDAMLDRMLINILEKVPQFDSKYIDAKLKELDEHIKTIPTEESIIKNIKKNKLLGRKDIQGMPLDDQKWHGGGNTISVNGVKTTYGKVNVVNSASVVVNSVDDNSTQTTTISFTSSGGTQLISYTGVVDGVNQSFTFDTAPSMIVADNVPRQKESNDGTVNWTGTTNVVLSQPPQYDLYAF